MSNTRKLAPRPPDETEAAFRDALRDAGCPDCGSRKVVGRYDRQAGVWDFGIRCEPDCPSHADRGKAHAIAARATETAGKRTGQPLAYRAFGDGSASGGAVLAGIRRGHGRGPR